MFPLWAKDTHQLARDFIESGFRAVLCTVDPKQLDASFCGRDLIIEMEDSIYRGDMYRFAAKALESRTSSEKG